MAEKGAAARIGRLAALYAAQGIPFGFATAYLPLQLTARDDFSYLKSTLFTLASFPWLLKVLWAPLADAHYSPRIGRRRSWILPAQALLVLTAIAGAFIDFQGPVAVLFGLAVLFNLWASVQDTAVDGLAVEMLGPGERGLGNAAQVAGYKLGMVAGGGGLVIVAERTSPQQAMLLLAGFVALLMLVPLLYREPPPVLVHETPNTSGDALKGLWQQLRGPGWVPTLVFIATVKVGETMVSTPMKQLLVKERGFSREEAAEAVALFAMVFSLAGSVLGGYAAGRWGRRKALVVFGVLQALGLLLLAAAFTLDVSRDTLVLVICIEHLLAGLLTPALFAYMMDISDPRIAATHYSLLALVELVAKGTTGAVAGGFIDAMGPGRFITACALLGMLPLLLMSRLRRPADHAQRP